MRKTLLYMGLFGLMAYQSLAQSQTYYDVTQGNGKGLRFWSSDGYKIHMGTGSEYHYGPVTDYSIKFNMSANTGRGWTWGTSGLTPVAALSSQGDFKLQGNMELDRLITRKASFSLTEASSANSWLRDDWLTGSYGPAKWNESSGNWERPGGTYNDIGGIIWQDEGTYFIREPAGTQTSFTNSELLNKAFLFADMNRNMGIGTTTPSSRLHVFNGSAGISPHSFSDLTIEDDDHGMILITTPNDKLAYFGFGDSDDQFVGGVQYDHASDKMHLRVNDYGHNLTIGSSGNVGIGNNSPAGDLQLTGLSQRMIFSTTTTNQESSARIEFWEDQNDIENSTKAHFAIQYDGAADRLRFRGRQSSQNNADLMTIKRDGNVGIGTTTPSEKLEVNGTIRSREVKVEANHWPDYVFEPDYDLRSLQETEQFIQTNNHLPEIPSATEVEENGIALSEMNALLLKKIEELTLHLIEVSRENELLQASGRSDKETMKALIMRVEKLESAQKNAIDQNN